MSTDTICPVCSTVDHWRESCGSWVPEKLCPAQVGGYACQWVAGHGGGHVLGRPAPALPVPDPAHPVMASLFRALNVRGALERCDNSTSGPDDCIRSGRRPDAVYGSDQPCWPCLIRLALGVGQWAVSTRGCEACGETGTSPDPAPAGTRCPSCVGVGHLWLAPRPVRRSQTPETPGDAPSTAPDPSPAAEAMPYLRADPTDPSPCLCIGPGHAIGCPRLSTVGGVRVLGHAGAVLERADRLWVAHRWAAHERAGTMADRDGWRSARYRRLSSPATDRRRRLDGHPPGSPSYPTPTPPGAFERERRHPAPGVKRGGIPDGWRIWTPVPTV